MSTDESDEEDSTLIERESADGHTYLSRSVPCEVSLDVVDYKNHSAVRDTGAFETYHLYVSATEVANECLPFLDANPREPSVTTQVRKMQDTLRDTPQDFVKKNNGLTLICDNISYDSSESRVTIDFSNNEGVCNGGHTYFAIQTLDSPLDENATVRIEAIQLPDELTGDERRDQIVGIAQARNDNQSLHTSSEADYLGYYDPYKECIGDTNSVVWHEGDSEAYPDAISAVHFIRLMYSLDPLSYHHPLYNAGGDRHKKLVISPGNIHSTWYDHMEDAMRGVELIPMRHMVPMIDDLFRIRDHLSYSLKDADLSGEVGGDSVVIRRTGLYRDYISNTSDRPLRYLHEGKKGFDLSNTFETILVGLFRSNVWRARNDDGDVDMIGWFINPEELWDRRQLSVLSQMSEYYQEVDSDAWQFQRQASPYEKDLYQFGWETLEGEEKPPSPAIIYKFNQMATHTDINTLYDCYTEVEELEEATHWLSQDDGCILISLEEREPKINDNFSLYQYVDEQ